MFEVAGVICNVATDENKSNAQVQVGRIATGGGPPNGSGIGNSGGLARLRWISDICSIRDSTDLKLMYSLHGLDFEPLSSRWQNLLIEPLKLFGDQSTCFSLVAHLHPLRIPL